MTTLTFTIPGKPVAKGRPRFARRGKFVSTYTPEATVRFEDSVALYAREAGARPVEDAPVVLDVVAVWAWPSSVSKIRRARLLEEAYREAGSGLVPKTTKPDADNVAKAVGDALEGVAYVRDGQVWLVRAATTWGSSPLTRVRVSYGANVPAFPERWW